MTESATEVLDFRQVAQLGEDDGKAAAKRLSAVCAELTAAGAHTAVERLRDIDVVVRDLPFPVIERLVAPERVLDELEQVQSQAVQRLHAWRNQAALIPLLITWVSLAVVVLARDRSGTVYIPIFATVALVDACLIGLVVVLTRLAHQREAAGAREYDNVARQLDMAVSALAIAVESQTMRTPVDADDWARAAGNVIEKAVQQTRELTEAGQKAVEDAARTIESAHTRSDDLIGKLAEQSRATLQSLQQATGQIVDRVVKEAVTVLHDAVAADRSLINDQLAPLVSQFQVGVDDFAKSYRVYQESTATFVAVTADLGAATKVLADSARSYTDIAESIDAHLRGIEGSQGTFIARVTESVSSMGTAATAMENMSTLLRDRLLVDLERITGQLNTSGERLASVDGNLVGTTGALTGAAQELRAAAIVFNEATPGRRRWPFRRRGRSTES